MFYKNISKNWERNTKIYLFIKSKWSGFHMNYIKKYKIFLLQRKISNIFNQIISFKNIINKVTKINIY